MKRKAGQPTKYKKEYCQQIIEYMKDGNSLIEFANEIEVHIDTLSEWAKVHKEFSVAKKRAVQLAEAHWERYGRDRMTNKYQGDNLNNAAWIFYMKARFGWRDNDPKDINKQNQSNPAIDQHIANANRLADEEE